MQDRARHRAPHRALSRRLGVHLAAALLGTAGWGVLKVLGATFVAVRLESAGAVYGTLVGVATMLVLLYPLARLFLTGAVLSAVLAKEPR